ncbi:phosphomannomutase/phosphoglucomutase [Candidatus Micrarchaeota archaeon]|nr:phosphomannomutase/phosphoglucomutase [Candidatus Micrarchaeota archaeon]
MNQEIFRQYDIRGLAGKDFDSPDVERIAKAIATFLGAKRIVVCADCRESSPAFHQAVVNGVTQLGVDVIDIGTLSTGVYYYSLTSLDVDGGIMITASHNPKEYNGLKICGRGVVKIDGDTGIRQIQKLANENKFKKAAQPGVVKKIDILPDYIKSITGRVKLSRKLRVGVDCGNGVGGLVAPKVFRALGCEVHELYCTPDPNFPNHIADPSKFETLADLQKLVREKKLDLGIGIDGDADRAIFVDEKTNILHGDRAVALFAHEIFDKQGNVTVGMEIKGSLGPLEFIKNFGGVASFFKTGHTNGTKFVRENEADVAGEISGHYFFGDNHACDDAIYNASRMLEIVSKKQNLSSLAEKIPSYCSTNEIRVDYPDDKKNALIEALKKKVDRKSFEVITLDGVRLQAKDSWGIARVSNTAPMVTFRFEGRTKKKLEEIYGVFQKLLGGELKLPPLNEVVA